jgi:hypothetical protein
MADAPTTDIKGGQELFDRANERCEQILDLLKGADLLQTKKPETMIALLQIAIKIQHENDPTLAHLIPVVCLIWDNLDSARNAKIMGMISAALQRAALANMPEPEQTH